MGDALEGSADREGGLRGLAGDAHMRAVVARDDDDARLAVDVYVHRLRAAIDGGCDGRPRRARVHRRGGRARGGDPRADGRRPGVARRRPRRRRDRQRDCRRRDRRAGAAARALVVTAREDLEIARQVRAALA
jgi:acetate kinase